jgi:HEPN domain-containing protein
MSAKKEVILQWVQRAENDLKAAEILFISDPLILDIACFHFQQAVEKYLKVFLVFHDKEFIFSHNIDYLLDLCAQIDAIYADTDPLNLSLYAVRTRYPHDHVAPYKPEVEYYLNLTKKIRDAVMSSISSAL